MNLFKNLLTHKKDGVAETPVEPPAADTPEYRDIEEAISRGEAFDIGERGEFNGMIYESRAEGNGWTPRQHPAVWMLISGK